MQTEGFSVWLGTRHLVVRCVAVWWTVTAGALGGAAVAWPGVARLSERGPALTLAPALDEALVELASCVLLGCAAWLWVTTSFTVAQALRGRPPAGRRGVRRWVLAACGVAALTGSLSPVSAAPGHPVPAATALPYPDRAVAPHVPDRTPGRAGAHSVVVRPGDSLWTIAADDLGSGAGPEEITARWHALYAANRARIGPDPDLVEPGLRLLLPGKDRS